MAFCDIVDSSDSTFVERVAMISPTDTAYRLLPTSPSARELMNAYTPGLFELKFAEERTRQAAPRVGLLVLLKTFQQLGYFVKVADVPDSVLRQVAEAAGYDVVPQELDDYDRGTLRVRHMALVRSWMGVSAFDREALRIIVKACVEASRVREDLADIINVAIEELLRKRFELPGFTTLFRAARTARATVNRSFYDRMSQALDPPTKARIDSLFDKEEDARQTPWDTVKIEPGQPTVKRVKRFLENAAWLKEQAVDAKALAGIPGVKLQRFALEGRALNASRMKEATPDKRYAFAVALIHRQRARALDECRRHADPSRASNAEWREGETPVTPICSPEAIGRSGRDAARRESGVFDPNSIRKSFSLSSKPRCRSASAWTEGRPRNSTL
jgi:hypothetical protein